MKHALIFDSGVGGLTVSEEIRRKLPNLRQSYVADDVFRPYGDKTEQALRARLPGLLSTLSYMLDPDIVVIACNTASTTALDQIRAELAVPVVGVVPAIKPAAQMSGTGRIAVLGTPGTVRRKYVNELIRDFAADLDVILHGSTILVELAEAKLSGQTVLTEDIVPAIAPLFSRGDVDVVVLACTHFPLLRPELENAAKSFSNHAVSFIDSGEAIARRVASLLPKNIPPHEERELAFLVGPQAGPIRKKAFKSFGFETVISLCPDS